MSRLKFLVGFMFVCVCICAGWHSASAQTPNKERIYFVFTLNRNQQIYSIRPDKTARFPAVVGSNFSAIEPDISPDGKKLLYRRQPLTSASLAGLSGSPAPTPDAASYGLYIANVDDPTQKPVLIAPYVAREFEASQAVWSPDGKEIAYINSAHLPAHIYIMNVDGSKRQITNGPSGELHPAWSPDGKYLVFESSLPPFQSGKFTQEIYLVSVNGGAWRKVTTLEHQSTDPAWSPDGKQIAFQMLDNGRSDIYIVNSDGSNPHALTQQSFFAKGIYYGVNWSPDGKKLVFGDFMQGAIITMDADGKAPALLTNGASPIWAGQITVTPDTSALPLEISNTPPLAP